MPFDPRSTSRLKLDLNDAVPAPQAITDEGFADYVGTASIADVVLDYPLEAPLIRQYRPASEVLSDAAITSGLYKPIVNSHPRDRDGNRVFVLPENASQHTRGVVTKLWADGNKLRVGLRVFDAGLLADIQAGKVDLSPGYDCDTVPGQGVAPDGTPYDATQRNHRINHIAVEYRGRNPGARLTADGQDGMEEIKALIASGKLSPEDIKALIIELQKAAGVLPEEPINVDAGDPMAAIADLTKRVEALESAMKTRKADSIDLDDVTTARLADKVAKLATTTAAANLRSISAARDLARPVIGAIKADGLDDVNAIHRDVIAAVYPDQAAAAAADYAAGRSEVLARSAELARSSWNRQRTTDAADDIHGLRNKNPKGRDEQEKDLANALKHKSQQA